MQTNQSTANAASYKSSDLQVAKASGTATKSFTMGHKMGLLTAAISTAATSVDNVITYDGNSWNGSTWTSSTKTTLSYYISRTFTSTNKPYVASNTLYYIGEPSANTITFTTSATDSGTTLYYAWTLDSSSSTSTVVGSAGSYKSLTIPAYSGKSFRQKIWNYTYTGAAKTWKAPHAGAYTIECWGAEGGDGSWYTPYSTYIIPNGGGKGGYAQGSGLSLAVNSTCYVYVGQRPSSYSGGWNGGGLGSSGADAGGSAGGGATDVRYNGTALANRIIVAGAGGGSGGATTNKSRYYGGAGGSSATRTSYNGRNATISAGGARGSNASHSGNATAGGLGIGGAAAGNWACGAGGGGYYGGGGGTHQTPEDSGGGGGGSSYISNIGGCPKHSSGLAFTSGQMIAGDASAAMPNPAGGSKTTGRSGHGYARITYTNP